MFVVPANTVPKMLIEPALRIVTSPPTLTMPCPPDAASSSVTCGLAYSAWPFSASLKPWMSGSFRTRIEGLAIEPSATSNVNPAVPAGVVGTRFATPAYMLSAAASTASTAVMGSFAVCSRPLKYSPPFAWAMVMPSRSR